MEDEYSPYPDWMFSNLDSKKGVEWTVDQVLASVEFIAGVTNREVQEVLEEYFALARLRSNLPQPKDMLVPDYYGYDVLI